jgi:hypothetical protein
MKAAAGIYLINPINGEIIDSNFFEVPISIPTGTENITEMKKNQEQHAQLILKCHLKKTMQSK